MTISTVTALPAAPTRDDSENFVARGDVFMPALVVLADEINATVEGMNTATAQVTADVASTAADVITATAQVTLATAQANFAAASAAAAAEITTAWDSGTEYHAGDIVYGSDFVTYRAKQTSTGQDPTADEDNVYWALAAGSEGTELSQLHAIAVSF